MFLRKSFSFMVYFVRKDFIQWMIIPAVFLFIKILDKFIYVR